MNIHKENCMDGNRMRKALCGRVSTQMPAIRDVGSIIKVGVRGLRDVLMGSLEMNLRILSEGETLNETRKNIGLVLHQSLNEKSARRGPGVCFIGKF